MAETQLFLTVGWLRQPSSMAEAARRAALHALFAAGKRHRGKTAISSSMAKQ
jgi:hypothetical protein